MRLTVKMLIEELSKHDGSLPVLVDGYEGGMDYAEVVREIFVEDQGPDVPWYYGPCEQVDETDAKAFCAVYIPR